MDFVINLQEALQDEKLGMKEDVDPDDVRASFEL
jgi:hypothetical protein